jgi:hypothetical protein
MTRFDWRTEDEHEALLTPAQPGSRQTWRLGRKMVLVVSLAVVLTASFGTWYLRRQAAEHTRQVEADILASFGLWQSAVKGADRDLFDTLLVGTEPSWQEFQRWMLARGLALNRPLLGLRLADEGQAAAANPQVILSPDWRTAEVAFNVTYRAVASRVNPIATNMNLADPESSPSLVPEAVPITLEQRLVFSRKGQRWALVRPPDEYWGELRTIETDYLTLTFHETDAAFAARFANDLGQELTGLAAVGCSNAELDGASRRCGSLPYVTLHLAVEPELWHAMTTLASLPLMRGRQQLLPSPSVVGRPVDDASYQFLYRLLTSNLVSSIRTRLAVPVALPKQHIAVACFPEDRRGQRLFLYDPTRFSWQPVETNYAFRQFSPLPDDSGLVIEQHVSASESTGLRLRLWTGREDGLLYDAPHFSRLMTVPFGWASPATSPHLLLHDSSGLPRATRFHLLDMAACGESGCAGQDLPGYPVWSPDGRQVIVMIDNGLYLGADREVGLQAAEIRASWTALGPGFNPFWLDDHRFGYARYIEQDGVLAVEVMLASLADPRPRQILAPSALAAAAGYRWPEQPIFVNHLISHPGRPNALFIGGILYSPPGDGRNDNREFRLFSLQVPPDAPAHSLKLLLSLKSVPNGYSSMLNANGAVPFSFSPDGRWILTSQAKGSAPGGWLLYLYNIEEGRLATYLTGHPPESFRYLFFDWSADGEWLVVVDDGFLRLFAPDYDYEQRVPLEQPVCGQVAWLNKN